MNATLLALVLFSSLSTSARASDDLATVTGEDAQQVLTALRSVGAPTHPGALDLSLVTTADQIVCGPLTQGATCSVEFTGITRTVERAQRLTRIIAGDQASGSSPQQLFTATNIFCREYRDAAKPLSCSFSRQGS